MKRNLFFSTCVTSAFMAGVMLISCNKDEVIEPEPVSENTSGNPTDNPTEDPPGDTTENPREPFEGVKVYEWIPAPGQFINEISASGGMTENLTTLEEANEWATQRLNSNQFVSLGSFGGYIVVGLDHSIMAREGEYDFYVAGNAFLSGMGGSNEPGIVWVMQDTNGNNLPDDQWYELAGSDSFEPETARSFSVTYYRPEAAGMDTEWKASDGSSGVVKYLGQFHKQDYYYPMWVKSDSYTLTGTLLSPRNSQNLQSGLWNNAAYKWGYADNVGSDNIEGDIQRTGFKISNAINPDGSKVELKQIDFVKIQTGVLANSGILGEISTEVCGFGE